METTNLSEKAYQIIKANLANYDNGSHLSAREYSTKIGMSYTPVREAFIRLQKEGFLKRVPNVGFFVVQLDARDITEIFQVRECLEKFVFEAIFDMIKDSDLKLMKELIEKQKSALKKGDIKTYMKLDDQFHMIFFKIYGNRYFTDLINNVREQYFVCSKKIAKSSSADGIREHEEILEQIKQKNKTEASNKLMSHIAAAKQRIKDGFINAFET